MNERDLAGELGRGLRERVSGLHDAPFDLQDVKGRAGEIRRRRRITTAIAATAVAAVVVSTAFLVAPGLNTSGEIPPAGPSPTIGTPSPSEDDLGWPRPLETADLPLGEPPAIGWLQDGTALHTPSVSNIELDRTYLDVVAFRDPDAPDETAASGWLGVYEGDNGYAGQLLDENGRPQGEPFQTSLSVAASAKGNQVLYVRDGELLLHDNVTAGTSTILTGVSPEEIEPIGVLGDAAYYNVVGEDQGWRPDGRIFEDGAERDPRRTGYFAYTAVHPDGWVLAVDELEDIPDPYSCSVIVSSQGNGAGRTCDFTLKGFSPDARHLVAGPTYSSGFGDRELAVVARDDSGGEPEPVVHYLQTGQTDADIMDARWEDEEHVLAITATPVAGSTDLTWQLVRIGLDGSVEDAAEPVVADEQGNPFAFVTGEPG